MNTRRRYHLSDGLAPRGGLQVQDVDVVVPASTGVVPLGKSTKKTLEYDHVDTPYSGDSLPSDR